MACSHRQLDKTRQFCFVLFGSVNKPLIGCIAAVFGASNDRVTSLESNRPSLQFAVDTVTAGQHFHLLSVFFIILLWHRTQSELSLEKYVALLSVVNVLNGFASCSLHTESSTTLVMHSWQCHTISAVSDKLQRIVNAAAWRQLVTGNQNYDSGPTRLLYTGWTKLGMTVHWCLQHKAPYSSHTPRGLLRTSHWNWHLRSTTCQPLSCGLETFVRCGWPQLPVRSSDK